MKKESAKAFRIPSTFVYFCNAHFYKTSRIFRRMATEIILLGIFIAK